MNPEVCSNAAIIVRRATPADLQSIAALSRSEPNAAAWSFADWQSYCAGPGGASGASRVLFVALASEHPATQGPLPASHLAGFAAGSLVPPGPGELENLVVAEPWRRQGLGLRLLHSMLLWCRSWCYASGEGSRLWLEVRESNVSARQFYERAGFSMSGRREGYYRSGESAIVMTRPLAK